MSRRPRYLPDHSRRAAACLAAMVAAATAAMASAPVAEAEVTCTYDGAADVLRVDLSADNDGASLALSSAGDAIQVRGGGPVLTCAGGSPTLANTDGVNVIDGSDNSSTPAGGDGSVRVSILEPSDFAPAVDFIIALNGGFLDSLFLSGTSGRDHFVLGNGGINFNADEPTPDVDAVLLTPIDSLLVSPGDGGDEVSAQGGLDTGAAFDGAAFVELRGDTGDDVVEGGNGAAGDLVDGGDGTDTVRGFGGADRLVGDALGNGDDTLAGGDGIDTIDHPFAQSGLTVDLAVSGPQDTGQGTDTITAVENVWGSSASDTLLGDAGPNRLHGLGGDDTLDGRAGADALDGTFGTDTVTYAAAPAGMTVDLTAGSATGGDADTLAAIDNVIGSSFADVLTGNASANSITGLAGPDVVSALAGADTVDVRDGGPDTASCGTEFDAAIADRRSVDSVDADCETAGFLPELPVPPIGDGAPPPAGDTELIFRLAGARTQRMVRQRAVIVRVRCSREACTTVARGSGKLPKLRRTAATSALTKLKLKPATKRLQPGVTERLKLRLTKRQRAAIRARLAVGKKPKVRVIVRATDVAGNAVRRMLTVTAKG